VTIASGGDVGIGTAPGRRFHVYHATADAVMRVQSGDANCWLDLKDGNTTANYKVAIGAMTDDMVLKAGGFERVRIESGGNVGIGTMSPGYLLHVDGSAGKPGGGSWSNSSDARLKENIHHIDGREALDLLSQLQGVTFEWVNPEEHSAGTRAGLIAQELEKVFPDWVEEIEVQGSDQELIPEGEKAKALHFPHDFNAYVIEAIKALDAENQALSDTVQEQDAAIAALQQQNSDLEVRLSALEGAAGATNNRTYSLPLGGLFLGSLLVVGIVVNRHRKQ